MFNFTRLLDRNAERWPDGEALVGSERVTHAELLARVEALALGLAAQGVARGDVVAIVSKNSIEFLELTFALNRIGAIFLPLNYRLAPAEWTYILNHSGAKGLVTEPEFIDQATALRADVPGLEFVASTGPGGGAAFTVADLIADNRGRRCAAAEADDRDVQRLMYTSGTTSRPKGVPLTYGNVLWKTFGHVAEFGLRHEDRTLMVGPLYHVGAYDLPGVGTLYVGGSLVIAPRFDPVEALQLVQSERPTNVWLAPAMVNAILNVPEVDSYDTTSIRFITNGGEKMPVAFVEKVLKTFPNAWLADSYGLTETVSGDTFLDREHVLSKIGSVGKPVVHLDIKIVAEDGPEVAPGVVGEILLRGPKVFHGYWKDPEATTAAFEGDWFRTGDAGLVDDDGYLFIMDRKKDMIVSGGENIASPEIERVLYENESVLEAAVVAVPDSRWGEVPKAVVVLREGADISPDELATFCAERLAKFKVPKTFEFTDQLPRTASGKVMKRLLR
jgi:fatty-acyl-CoA synthase